MNIRSELGHLSSPDGRPVRINSREYPLDTLMKFYREMYLIRVIEEVIGEMVESGEVRCPCHLGIGQEAVAVGICSHLGPNDAIYGAHRSHSHYIALGGSIEGLLAEVLGKNEGCSHGFGGSMHLRSENLGLKGTVPIVAATIPIMVGSALASKLSGDNSVAVAFFGDGATEEGVFHESLNMAKVLDVPAVFVIENNLYASHLHIDERQTSDSVARFAVPHRIPTLVLDGNDVMEVHHEVGELIAHARFERTPVLVEAVTYRWRGHVGNSEDLDVGVERSGNLDGWKKLDPIARLADEITERFQIARENLRTQDNEIMDQVREAQTRARRGLDPTARRMMEIVYSQDPA